MLCERARQRLITKEKQSEDRKKRLECLKYDFCPDCGGDLKHKNSHIDRFNGQWVTKKQCKECKAEFEYVD